MKVLKKGKKAEQYRKQIIVDKHGVHNFDDDPEAYRKARKREQNRVSAVNSRKAGKTKVEELELEIRQLADFKAKVLTQNEELQKQNEQLRKLLEAKT